MKTVLNIFLLLSCFTSNAQRNSWDIGLEGGMTLGWLHGNDVLKTYHAEKNGGVTGIYGQYNLPRHFSFRSGLYFEQKGSSFVFPAVDANGNFMGYQTGHETMNYITIPLIAQFSFGKTWRPFVNLGGFLGMLQSQKEHFNAFGTNQGQTYDRSDLLKKTEIGISTGLGIAYQLKLPLTISVEARNNLGLTNISAVAVYNNGKVLTNTLNLLVGVSYRLGQR